MTTDTAASPRLAAKPGKYLTFLLAAEHYGIPVLQVREIIQLCDITPVPRVPHYFKGVINLRGKIIPVVDLCLKLRLPKGTETKRTCIVVVQVGGHQSIGI